MSNSQERNSSFQKEVDTHAMKVVENDSISVLGILLFLAKSLKVLIIIPLIMASLAIVYVSFIAKPSYISTATILPSGGSDALSGMRGLASQFGVSIPDGMQEADFLSAEMYREIIKSRTLSELLLKNMFDTEKYGLQKSLLEILTNEYGDTQADNVTKKQIAIDLLIEEIISVRKDIKSDLLTIRIESFDPHLAHDLNMALLDELDQLQKRFKLDNTREKMVFIEGRVSAVRKQLESTEESLKEFRDNNRQIQNSPGLLLQEERLKREVQVQIGVFTSLKQQLEYNKIEAVQKSSLVQVLDWPNTMLSPVKPNKKMFVILAGFLGILISLVVASVRHLFQVLNDKQMEKVQLIKDVFLSRK